MKKVITYGTFDLLHHGHIRLLERAKELGDYLIVAVTSEGFDRARGKINVQQSLMQRIKAVKETGLADEILIEEYEGQKIDDIINYGVDVFTVGSDWVGKFDYLKEYCEVVYLDRTKGISSTDIRTDSHSLKMGAIGNLDLIKKYITESSYVNGVEMTHFYSEDDNDIDFCENKELTKCNSYQEVYDSVDAVYIASNPEFHYEMIKEALNNGKSVLYEAPMTTSVSQCKELIELANSKDLILMDASKTMYSQAYNRLILLLKSGIIGDVVSIDSTCTSLSQLEKVGMDEISKFQSSICAWGPTAMLPIFQLLGTNYIDKNIVTLLKDENDKFDLFTKIDFLYDNAVASIKVGKGVKSESDLVVTGTKGYVYVPSPWWKTDYFEVRYENPNNTKRYFYNLEGEGIRFELVNFVRAVTDKKVKIKQDISTAIVEVVEDYYDDKNVEQIKVLRK